MANREIEARLKLSTVDKSSRVIRGVARALDEVGRKSAVVNRAEAAAFAAQRRAAAVDRQILGVGRHLAGAVAIGAAAAGLKASITNFAELERQVTRLGLTAGASRKELERVPKSVAAIARDTATPLADVFSGLEVLVAAGRSLPDAMGFLPSVVRTAQATGAEVSDIANSADALATSMGIAGDQMEIAFDKMAKGGKLGKFELRDMAQYLPSILPLMKSAGYSGLGGLESAVAALQTMRMTTGDASTAATYLTNILTKMVNQDTQAKFKKFFKIDLNKELDKAVANGEDLLTAFVRISREATGGDMREMAKIFTDQQFGQGMLALIQNPDAWRDFILGMRDASGTVRGDLNVVLEDAQAKLDRLANAWDRFTTSVGSAAVSLGAATWLENWAEGFERMADAIDRIGKSGFIKGLAEAAGADVATQAKRDPGVAAYYDAYRKAAGGDPTTAAGMSFATTDGGTGYSMFAPGSPEEAARIEEARKSGYLAGMAVAYAPLMERARVEDEARTKARGSRQVMTTREPGNGPAMMPHIMESYPHTAALYPMPVRKFYTTRHELDAPHVGTMLDLMPGAMSAEALRPLGEAAAAMTEAARAMGSNGIPLPMGRPAPEAPAAFAPGGPAINPTVPVALGEDLAAALAASAEMARTEVGAVAAAIGGMNLSGPARAAVETLNAEFGGALGGFVSQVIAQAARLRAAGAASGGVRVDEGQSMANN